MKKQNMPRNSMWEAVIWGLVASVLFSILGAAIGASIVNAGAVRETGVAWISALIWAVSIFCGVMLSLKIYQDNLIEFGQNQNHIILMHQVKRLLAHE